MTRGKKAQRSFNGRNKVRKREKKVGSLKDLTEGIKREKTEG